MLAIIEKGETTATDTQLDNLRDNFSVRVFCILVIVFAMSLSPLASPQFSDQRQCIRILTR